MYKNNKTYFYKILQPMLEQNNVKLVGVGVEEFGVKKFIDGKYFEGGNFLCCWAIFF